MKRGSTVTDVCEEHIHVKCIACGEALIAYTPDITFRDIDMAIKAHELETNCGGEEDVQLER